MPWIAVGLMLGITGLVITVHVVTGRRHYEPPPDPWQPPSAEIPHIPAQPDGTDPAADRSGARSGRSAEEPFDR
jgi:hypothetical protein